MHVSCIHVWPQTYNMWIWTHMNYLLNTLNLLNYHSIMLIWYCLNADLNMYFPASKPQQKVYHCRITWSSMVGWGRKIFLPRQCCLFLLIRNFVVSNDSHLLSRIHTCCISMSSIMMIFCLSVPLVTPNEAFTSITFRLMLFEDQNSLHGDGPFSFNRYVAELGIGRVAQMTLAGSRGVYHLLFSKKGGSLSRSARASRQVLPLPPQTPPLIPCPM